MEIYGAIIFTIASVMGMCVFCVFLSWALVAGHLSEKTRLWNDDYMSRVTLISTVVSYSLTEAKWWKD